VVLVVAVAPFFVALAAAHRDGWRPLGDDAVVAVLTHDVFSPRTPLVGMPSTLNARRDAPRANHLGPLEFWSLAPLERLFRSAPFGILLGVALINALAIATVGVVTYRLAGPAAAAAALAIGVTVAWSLGRQTIVDPWNPFLAVLPLLALCVVTWAAVTGRRRALWGAALLASYVAQLHLLYVPLAVALLACAIGGVATTMLRSWRRGALSRRDVAVTVGGTLGILLVAWSFPIVDQIAHSPGNFDLVAHNYNGTNGTHVGLGFAVRVVAQAIGLPPLFARRNDRIPRIGGPWSQLSIVLIVTAAVAVAVLVAGTIIAFRRRDRVGFGAGATACVALLVTTIAISRLPVTFPEIPRYRFLQCWSVGAFTWLATGVVIGRAVAAAGSPIPPSARRALRLGLLGAIVVVLAGAPVAVAFANSEGHEDARVFPAVGRLAANIAAKLDPNETYVLSSRSEEGLVAFNVEYGLYRELARRGLKIRVPHDDPYLARAHGAPPDAHGLLVVTGRQEVDSRPKSDERLAYSEIASPSDHAQLRDATEQLHVFLRERSNLTAKGRETLATGTPEADAHTLAALLDGSADPVAMFDDGRVLREWITGFLRPDLLQTREVKAYQAARRTVNDLVFAAYLEP
jgi:hypothetical protein